MPEKSNEKSQNLTDKQRLAINLIVRGKNDGVVASEVGVTRETVNRWKHEHACFQAELNSERYGLWDKSTRDLEELSAKAVEVLKAELEGENRLKAAVHVLKALGMYGHKDNMPSGPTDPEEIKHDWEECGMFKLW